MQVDTGEYELFTPQSDISDVQTYSASSGELLGIKRNIADLFKVCRVVGTTILYAVSGQMAADLDRMRNGPNRNTHPYSEHPGMFSNVELFDNNAIAKRPALELLEGGQNGNH